MDVYAYVDDTLLLRVWQSVLPKVGYNEESKLMALVNATALLQLIQGDAT